MSVNKILNEDEQILTFKYNQVLNRVICPKCSSELLYFDEYCHNCGNKLNKSSIIYIPNIKNIKQKKDTASHDLSLKYACVTVLRQMMFNPLYSDKENFLIKAFRNVNFYDVRKYLVNEGFVEILTGRQKHKAGLKVASDEYIDQVLTQKELKKGISKADNITILISSLSEQELDAMIPNYYKVTEKGVQFYEQNKHCRLYSIVFYDFDLEHYDKTYNESNSELKDFALKLLDESFNEVVPSLKWQSYSDLLYKYAEIYDINQEYDNELYYVLQHFICQINPFADNKIKDNLEIPLNLRNMIIYSISKADIAYEKLIQLVDKAVKDIMIPKNFISSEEIMLIIEELFDSEIKLNDINTHLTGIYNHQKIEPGKYVFNNEEEQKKVINELENIFSI